MTRDFRDLAPKITANGTIIFRTFKNYGPTAGRPLGADRTIRARITAKRATTVSGWLTFDVATGKEILPKRRHGSGYQHELIGYTLDRQGGDEMTQEKIGPKALDMLQRIARGEGRILVLSLVASGGGQPRLYTKLVAEKLVEEVDHPTVKVSGYPAPAAVITDAGRALLEAKRGPGAGAPIPKPGAQS